MAAWRWAIRRKPLRWKKSHARQPRSACLSGRMAIYASIRFSVGAMTRKSRNICPSWYRANIWVPSPCRKPVPVQMSFPCGSRQKKKAIHIFSMAASFGLPMARLPMFWWFMPKPNRKPNRAASPPLSLKKISKVFPARKNSTSSVIAAQRPANWFSIIAKCRKKILWGRSIRGWKC